MASLGVHYVKSRQECKDCLRKKTGLIGIASKCLGIEVHAGATHKYYHPNCFFEGSKFSEVIDKLPYKTAEGMTGYKNLSHSDQLMVYSLFANATDAGDEEEEEERLEQRKCPVASKRSKKGMENTEKQKKSKEEEGETPKKRRRTEKKEKTKKMDESDEEEVIQTTVSTRRLQREKREAVLKNVTRAKGNALEEVEMDDELEEIEVAREENTSAALKVKGTPSKKEDAEKEIPRKEKPKKVEGRGKPSVKMTALFEKLCKRKIDEQVDLELDSDDE